MERREPTVVSVPTYSRTRISGWYFAVQGAAIAAWWVCLWRFPETRAVFVPPGGSETELLAFSLPDLLVAAPLSVAASVAFFFQLRFVLPLAWMSTGAMAYALSYCVAWSLLRQGAWINVVLMSPPTLLSAVCAVDLSAGATPIFRKARAASTSRHVAVTLGRIVVFWTFFLGLVPLPDGGGDA